MIFSVSYGEIAYDCTGCGCCCLPRVEPRSISDGLVFADDVHHEASKYPHRADVLPESTGTKQTCELVVDGVNCDNLASSVQFEL